MEIQNKSNQLIFQCEVIRKHLLIDKHYQLQIFENKIIIRENVQYIKLIFSQLEHPPKYEIDLSLKSQVSWKHSDDHKIKEFGIKYFNKTKWFTGQSAQMNQMKTYIQTKVFMQGISGFYSSHDIIGSGASCKVILVKDYNANKSFAAKCISKDYIKKKRTSDRFDRLVNEIQILRTLKSHPNLIKLNEIFEGENSYYLVFDYLDGENLHKFIKNQSYQIPEQNVRTILHVFYTKLCQQLLLGIRKCHQQNIIHRDMKLENVMLSKMNSIENIKIIDFGLAIFNTPDYPFAVCGTPGYIAPEILNYEENKYKNERFSYSPQIDMFGIGVMLYRIMTKQPLFAADKTKELINKNQKCMYVKHTISQYSNILNQILYGLLEYNPKKRLTADQALELLQAQQFNQITLRNESTRNINLNDEFQIPIYNDVVQAPYLFPNRKIKKEMYFMHSYHLNEDRVNINGKSYLPSFTVKPSLDFGQDSLLDKPLKAPQDFILEQ
ncbi:unnamed protein product (macronuclear) [Paramecium tetraurelia]|uniref:Protein kinase domain-containing protein n=1 Tax=Paramecium tetraurelia TaxID=5888 RepID=A0BQE8_PARTE|nr:uncharacterized protein GSPATT00030994001 [Paramecium tetraurelia]CAK60765.1 unnamed protein product [Paramecium tetraurelia]|eukprot:XP_001428163.1 hypothetical protein (macronuclear) [Paramecium tetraurelia strain d4-2]